MIKLMDLLAESPASDDAHKRGLTSAGWGKWKTSSGEVVAKTEKGKLVLLKKANQDQQTKSSHKKTTKRSTKHAAVSNQPSKNSVEVGKSIRKQVNATQKQFIAAFHIPSFDQEAAKDFITNLTIQSIAFPQLSFSKLVSKQYAVKHGFYDLAHKKSKSKQLIMRKAMQSYIKSIHQLRAQHTDTHSTSQIEILAAFGDTDSKQILKTIKLLESNGLQIHSVVTGNEGEEDLHKTMVKSHQLKSVTSDQNLKLATKQNKTWRNQMTNEELESMSEFQDDWQRGSIWKSGGDHRNKIFKGINNLTRKYKVPDSGVPVVYRGMSMMPKNAAKFLSIFKPGQSVTTPPSGYTSKYDTALGFAENFDHPYVIIFNMKSSAGNVHGIHFANELVFDSYDKKRSIGTSSYVKEQEIVIPSVIAQKVADIQTDIIQYVDDFGLIHYTIETNVSLVQMSKPMKEKTIYESSDQSERLSKYLLIKYMGGSVHGESKPTRVAKKPVRENSVIKLMDLLEEAFKDSADIMGMIEFYKRAEPEAQIEMERLIDAGDWKAVHDFIEKTTKTHIVSFTQNNSWRASRKGAS